MALDIVLVYVVVTVGIYPLALVLLIRVGSMSYMS